MLEIYYSRQALSFLFDISPKDSQRIRKKIGQYAENPDSLKNQVKKLQGQNYYRLRVGDYRVIFNKNGQVLDISKIDKRSDVYKTK